MSLFEKYFSTKNKLLNKITKRQQTISGELDNENLTTKSSTSNKKNILKNFFAKYKTKNNAFVEQKKKLSSKINNENYEAKFSSSLCQVPFNLINNNESINDFNFKEFNDNESKQLLNAPNYFLTLNEKLKELKLIEKPDDFQKLFKNSLLKVFIIF